MSTQIANNMGPEVKKNLPAKYMRYMSYTYWLATQLRNADAISADVFNELMKGQKLHATVDVQINHFASFDDDEKTVTKAMKKEVRQAAKPKKEKKTKEKDPNEPEKKRGRKKKVKINAETDEEKLIASIVASARGSQEESKLEPQQPEEDSVSEVSKSSSEASTTSKKAAKELKKAAKEAEKAAKLAAKEAEKVFIEIFGTWYPTHPCRAVKRKHEDARRLKGKENPEERADKY